MVARICSEKNCSYLRYLHTNPRMQKFKVGHGLNKDIKALN